MFARTPLALVLRAFGFLFQYPANFRRLFMNRFISVRTLPVVLALGVLSLTARRLTAQELPFHSDGTFTFIIDGNTVDASGGGHAAPGGDFTFHDQVKIKRGGRELEGTLTLRFASGSTLTIYYDAPVSSDRIVTSPYWVVGGTGFFEGASGYGIIWYPIGQDAPFTLDGEIEF
jgi:hypothetical protein